MVVFWTLAALMTLVALAFVLVPLLRTRAAAAPSSDEANLEVLQSQRREIEFDIASGTLPAASRDEALAELLARAQQDLEATRAAPAQAPARRPWVAAAVAAIAVPAIAFGLYAAVGNPQATNPLVALGETAAPDDKQIVDMVERLAVKVRERPDDAQGWALLARSMAALGRFGEAAAAYENLARLSPGDAQVLADFADALGMAQGRSLAGRPEELARQALAIDPRQQKALALAGTAALDRGDFAAAVGHWTRLAAELPADSADAAQVNAILDEIRSQARAQGSPVPEAPRALAQGPGAAPAAPAAGKTVTGSVSLAPALAAKVSGGETLFIFARASAGPRVPLAVVRANASQLPMRFALDDSQAMAPGMTLSSAAEVRIEARISRSGNATPQPGDLVGSSGVVRPGARDVGIVVDRILP